MEGFWMFPLFRHMERSVCLTSRPVGGALSGLSGQKAEPPWMTGGDTRKDYTTLYCRWCSEDWVEQHSLQRRAAGRMDKSAVRRSWHPVCTVCLAESGVFHSELHGNKQTEPSIRALRTSWSGVSTAVMRTSCRFTHRCESCKNTPTKNDVSALFKFMLPGNLHASFPRRENWIKLVLNDWFSDSWPPSSVRAVMWWGSRAATISRCSTIFCGDNRKSRLDDRLNQSLEHLSV